MSYQSKIKINDDWSVETVRIQDTTQILKSIESARREKQTGDHRFAARVPITVLCAIQKKIGITHMDGTPKLFKMNKDEMRRLFKELNSNEWNLLRVWDGKL